MKHLPDTFRPRKRRAGFLLPMVAIYILVAFILSFGILMVGSGDQSAAFRRLRREQAFYLAEAGLQRALAEISRDGLDSVSWPVAGALAPGGFTVPEPAEEGGIFTLFATGTAGSITETVSLSFSPGAAADAGGSSIFAQGCFGRSRVELTGSSRIEAYDSSGLASDPAARVGSNTEVKLAWSTVIDGSVAVSDGGSITTDPTAPPLQITGDKIYDAGERELAPVEIPDELAGLPPAEYGDPGLGPGSGEKYTLDAESNYAITLWPRVASISGGDYRFNDFYMSNDAKLTLSGEVRLYIEGNLQVVGDSQFILAEGATVQVYLGQDSNFSIANSIQMNYSATDPAAKKPANLAIYSASTNAIRLDATGNARVNAVLYAPLGKVTVANSTVLRGTVVADQVEVLGNARLYEDVSLREDPSAGSPGGDSGAPGEMEILRWTKPGWAGRLTGQ